MRFRTLLPIIATIGFIGCEKSGSNLPTTAAGVTATPVGQATPNFDAVAGHLDYGGVFYGVMDVDGDLNNLAESLSGLQSTAVEMGILPPDLDVRELVRDLGFNSIKSVGMSSRKSGELFVNKAFAYIPDGRDGLMKTLGGDPEPFHIMKIAPADTHLLIEQEFNIEAIHQVVKKISAKFIPPDEENPIEKMLDQQVMEMSFTFADLIGKANGRVMILARINPDQPLQFPNGGPPVDFPSVDLLIGLENMAWVYDDLKEKLTEMGGDEISIEDGDGYGMISILIPEEMNMGLYEPVIYFDKKSDRVFAASRKSYLDHCLGNSPRIDTNPDFQKLTEGLPTEGNGLSFLSPAIFEEVDKIVTAIGEEEDQFPAEFVLGMLKKFKSGSAAVTVNLQDGVFSVGNAPVTHKTTLLGIAVNPMIVAVGAASAFGGMRGFGMGRPSPRPNPFPGGNQAQMEEAIRQAERARADAAAQGQRLRSSRTAQPTRQDPNALKSAKLRNLYLALSLYAVDNGGKYPADIKELEGTTYLQDGSMLLWTNEDGSTSPVHYVAGLSDTSPSDQILLAAPASDANGKRLVVQCDGSVKLVDESALDAKEEASDSPKTPQ